MSKVIYTSEPMGINWRYILPWCILQDVLRHRSLIATTTIQDFKAAYRASYLGLTWQILLPIIMLAIFYLVFGKIFHGRFLQNGHDTALGYALALSVGMGLFNYVSQNINTAPGLIASNVTYVKTLSFPLEILPITSVLNALIGLVISLLLVIIVLFVVNGHPHASAILTPFYILCIFLLSLGLSWSISALAVFVRDITPIVSPLTLILMFMCPIFYPLSMVPKSLKWIISANPLALIIEDERSSLLYGYWPSLTSMLVVFVFSLCAAIFGYFVFMRSKPAFADVL